MKDYSDNLVLLKTELNDKNNSVYEYVNFDWVNRILKKTTLQQNEVVKIIQTLCLKYWQEEIE